MNRNLVRAIDPAILKKMADAIHQNKLGVLAVLSHELVEKLNRGEVAEMDLEDGGVIVLIPQALVDKLYPPGKQGDREDDHNNSSEQRQRKRKESGRG